MKMQFACLLLVLLAATGLSQDPTFQQKHVITAAEKKDCTTLMNSRNLIATNDPKICTNSNTFIVENDDLKNICAGGVTEKKSKEAFQILDCTNDTKNSKPGKCVYISVTHSAKILLQCKDNQPERFKGAIRN